jgi:23S rRNA (adenine2503-C2)-methyltransferase
VRIEQLRQTLRSHGALACHEERVLRAWTAALPLASGARRQRAEDYLPRRIRESLPALEGDLNALAGVRSAHTGEDGSERLLVELADGQMVESVLLPRDGLCVSTQVGCAVGCLFCMTGRDGLLRQLDSAEIVAQVVLGRARRSVRRVVFMGMGEPAHNLDNVLEAIDLLGTAGGIGHKNLVFSTVGDHRVFERLPQQRVVPALALSLHSTNAELRARLLPRAPRIDPPSWSNSASAMRAPPATRSSTNGRFSKGSTTARRRNGRYRPPAHRQVRDHEPYSLQHH